MVNNVSHSKYANDIRKSVKSVKSLTLANMRTKGQCKLSEKELVKKITDLAHRDAAAGRNSLHDDCKVGSEFNKLYDDFLSFVSPDRAGIIQKKLAQLSGGTSFVSGKSDKHTDAFKVLFALLRKKHRHNEHNEYNEHNIHDPDVGTNFISFKDEQGREVAHYGLTVGWFFTLTPAEIARHAEFIDLWNRALTDAQEGSEPSAEAGIIFEAKA